MTSRTPRRDFLERVGLALLGTAAAPAVAHGLATNSESQADEPWLKGLTGKHRQIFDVPCCGRGGRWTA